MKHIHAILFALLTITGFGQSRTVDLNIQYGVDFTNGSKTLTQQLGNIATVQTKLKDFYGWAKVKGWSDAEIMNVNFSEAAWHNVIWMGENGNYNSPAPGHAWNIIVPDGKFYNKTCMPAAQGTYSGQNSRPFDGNNAHSYGGTTWIIDHEGWMWNRYPEQFNIRTLNWGQDGGDIAWSHHTKIKNMAFDGASRVDYWVNDGKIQGAIGLWDPGEVSLVEECYLFDQEKDGIVFARATPGTVKLCSLFGQRRYGVSIMGGGNIYMERCSGDEHGVAMVGGRPAFGRPCATQLTMTATKQETGTSNPFRPYKGSALIDFDGWLVATIDGLTYSAGWVKPYAMIIINPTSNQSSITVTGVMYWDNAPKCLIYDKSTNTEYTFVGNTWFNLHSDFEWIQGFDAKGDFGNPGKVVRTGPKGQMKHCGADGIPLNPDGSANWAASYVWDGTNGTTQPPSPCTYTYSAWSTCTNGTQTRTVLTALPSGCTGTPVLSQPCGVTPSPCTYTKTGTGPCVSGQSLDTYSASPTGCTGTAPVTYTTCTTGAVKASYNFSAVSPATITAQVGTAMKQTDGAKRVSSMSGGKITNTNGNANYPVSWTGATSITVTGFVASAMNYQLICGKIDTDGFGRGIMLLPNGSVIDNTLSGGDRVLLPAGTVKIGTAVTFTAQFSAMDIQFFGGANGNAWQGTFDELKVQ